MLTPKKRMEEDAQQGKERVRGMGRDKGPEECRFTGVKEQSRLGREIVHDCSSIKK